MAWYSGCCLGQSTCVLSIIAAVVRERGNKFWRSQLGSLNRNAPAQDTLSVGKTALLGIIRSICLHSKHLTDFLNLEVQVFQKLPCLSVLLLNIQQTLEMFVQIKNSTVQYPDWKVMGIL